MSQQYPNFPDPSQQYQYHYGPAPPPDWQAPQPPIRSSWQDPRFRIASPSQVPPPQYVPGGQSSGFTQQPTGAYDLIQSSSPSPVSPIQQQPAPIPYYGQNVTTWGVNYNRAQQNAQLEEQRPPLPPRPSTTSPHEQWYQEPAPAPGLGSTVNVEGSAYEGQLMQSDILSPPPPPLPPKRPVQSHIDWPQENAGGHLGPSHPTSHHDGFSTVNPSQVDPSGNGTSGLTSNSNLSPPPPPPRPSAYHYDPAQPSFNPPSNPYTYQAAPEYIQQAYGSQPTQTSIHSPYSPPPVADYNLTSPWSDPFIPAESPHQGISGDHHMTTLPEARQELTDEKVVHGVDHEEVSPQETTHSLNEDNSPSRDDDVSPEPDFTGIHRTGTIDSVIQAWTKPTETDRPVAQGTNWNDPGLAGALKQLSLLSRTTDPYHDLSAEARASMDRFVAMLRKESAAETDEEKFSVFNSFVQRETRLRTVLYGIDPSESMKPDPDHITNTRKQSNSETATARVEINTDDTLQAAPEKILNTSHQKSGTEVFHSDFDQKATNHDQLDTSYGVGNPWNEADNEGTLQFSPGGRPILRQSRSSSNSAIIPEDRDLQARKGASAGIDQSSTRPDKANGRVSPGSDAPIPVMENSNHEQPNPNNDKEDQFDRPSSRQGASSNPARAYTPFSYQAVSQHSSSSDLLGSASANSYTALRKANIDSGRVLAPMQMKQKESIPELSPDNRQDNTEMFLGLLRQRSKNDGRDRTPSPAIVTRRPSSEELHERFQKLRTLIPANLPSYSESETLAKLKKSLGAIPDDFNFIHGAVLAWNRGNLGKKKRLDAGRRQRAEESERNIESMFNDNEIGYADIATLEEENRIEEAKIAANEEIQEVDSFRAEVFDSVTNTVQGHLNTLALIYADAMTLVERQSVSGSQFLKASSASTALPQAMDLLLVIYGKMQVRHQKLLEAQLELQRRTRKAKVHELRAGGHDVRTIQEQEVALLKAEQTLIIDAKEKDDDRANFLMDTFDQAVVKGLAENQAFTDRLLSILQALSAKLKQDVPPSDVNTLRDVLLSAQAVLEFLNADSTSILKYSSTADEILNNADYDVSVAKAYRKDASPQEMRSLENEKITEDQKIRNETAAKMDSMAHGGREAQALVKDLLRRMENSPEHKQRIEQALERAKQRNAANP